MAQRTTIVVRSPSKVIKMLVCSINDSKGINSMLSVIVPVYNCEEYLRRCVDSILEQTEKSLEIILVDDGSTDHSGLICDSYMKSESTVKVIHKENGGLISARIAGVKAATSDWIGFVDSDDYIDNSMYRELLDVARKYECDLVSSGIIKKKDGEEKEEILLDHFSEGLYNNLEKDIFPTMIYDFDYDDFGLYCNLVNKIFRRDLLLSVYQSLDTSVTYGEDAATLYKYCLRCNSIYILKSAFYYYCIRNNSMSDNKHPELAQNTYKVFYSLKNDFISHRCRNDLMRQLKRYIFNIEMHYLEKCFDINPGVLNEWKFCYPEDVLDHKFVIYGAGGCGQALFHEIRRKKKDCNLVAWADKAPEKSRRQIDYDVVGVEDLKDYDFDYIIIAIKDKVLADDIGKDLSSRFDISYERFVFCDCEEESFFSKALF